MFGYMFLVREYVNICIFLKFNENYVLIKYMFLTHVIHTTRITSPSHKNTYTCNLYNKKLYM